MRGFFSIGVYHPKASVNVGTLWRSAHLFGAAYVFTIGQRYKGQASDTMKTPRHVPLFHWADLDDLHLPWNCQLVGVELCERAQPLDNFEHPERACYLLGAEDHGLPDWLLDRCHSLVQIELEHSINVATMGSLVMWERWRKTGRIP